jgi:hypothetical protein
MAPPGAINMKTLAWSKVVRMSAAPAIGMEVVRARWAVSAVFAVFGTLFGSWLPHIPDVKVALGIDDSAIGQALLCSGLGAVVSMQFVGAIIGRFSSRQVAIAGGTGACLLVPLLVSHGTVLGLCVNLLILGMFYGILDVAMNAHAVEVQNRYDRPIMSSIHAWFSCGGILGGLTAARAANTGMKPAEHLGFTSIAMLFVLAISYRNMLRKEGTSQSSGPKFVVPRGV